MANECRAAEELAAGFSRGSQPSPPLLCSGHPPMDQETVMENLVGVFSRYLIFLPTTS